MQALPKNREALSSEKEIVSIDNLSKKLCRNLKYSFIYGLDDLFNQLRARPLTEKLRKNEFWALRDISFAISPGETTAIIGRNGAGKTTLLRLIAGLIKPNRGSISVSGRVVPLIALGAGFSNILSGKENAETFLSVLGMKQDEIRNTLAKIFEFAELQEFKDDPVSSYSSGMVARLAFSCAVHAKPDILLIDEVLAVGDLSFHLRCYQKLAALKENGCAIVLVSHNLTSVISLANRAIYLEKGLVKQVGEPKTVCSRYEEDLRKDRFLDLQQHESTSCRVSELKTQSLGGAQLQVGQPGEFIFKIDSPSDCENLVATLLIKHPSQNKSYTLFLSSENEDISGNFSQGENFIKITLTCCSLAPGDYLAKISVIDKLTKEILAIHDWHPFTVAQGNPMNQSVFYQPTSWEVSSVDKTKQKLSVLK